MSQVHRVMTVAALLLGAAVPGFCAGVVVVGDATGVPGGVSAASLDEALDLVTNTEADTIWLPPATYSYNFDFGASDPDVTIIGRGLGISPAPPLQVTIEAADAGLPVVELNTVTSKIVFQNLTLTGGTEGVRLDNGGAQVVFDRCYIMGNTGSGVLCSGLLPRGTFVNCSIYGNGGDGIRVVASGTTPPGNATLGTEILHCTILKNEGCGVYVAGNSAARVRNTLAYQNTGSASGNVRYEYLVGTRQNLATGLSKTMAITGSEWAFGDPLGGGGAQGNPDPNEAHTPTTGGQIYGVNLSSTGDYRVNIDGDAQWSLSVDKDAWDIEPAMSPPVMASAPGYPSSAWNVNLGKSVVVGDVNVVVDAVHPRPGQLWLQLTHAGHHVVLLENPDDHGFPNLLHTVFDDEAGTKISDSLLGFSGAFRPKEKLSEFDGLPLDGQWVLNVHDSGGTVKYAYSDEFAAHGFVIDEIPSIAETQWNFLTPMGQDGGEPTGNPDPNGQTDGTGTAINVNANGVYDANVDGVYTDDPNDLEYLASGAPVITEAGELVSWTATQPPATGDPVVIGDLNVKLDIAHHCASGLTVKLTHEGTTVTLTKPFGDCASNFTETLLDDEAATPIVSAPSTDAPFSSVYSPVGDLSDFDGMPFGGAWTLEVLDPGNLGAQYEFLTAAYPAANGLTAEILSGSASEWAFGVSQGQGGIPGNPDPPAGAPEAGVNLGGNYTPNMDGDAQYATLHGDAALNELEFTDTPNMPTLEGGTKAATLTVVSPAVAGDVNVVLNITHPVPQNLSAKLTHNGREVNLFANPVSPGAAENFSTTVLDDEASQPITSGNAPFHAAFRPVGSPGGLSAFDGVPVAGPWVLELTDALGGKVFLDEQFDNGSPPEPTYSWENVGTGWVVNPGAMLTNTVLEPPMALCDEPGSNGWQDYTFDTEFRVTDWATATLGTKEIGVVFCVQPSLNQYYKFVIKDFVGGQHWVTASLVKHTSLGVDVPLVAPTMISLGLDPFNTAFPVHVNVKVVSDLLTFSGSIAGFSIPAVLTSITDPTPLNSGTVGFVAQNLYGEFDYARVTGSGTFTGTLNSWALQVEPMHYMLTPKLDFTGKGEVHLAFRRWLNTGADSIASVECFNPDAGTWDAVYNNENQEVTDDGWDETLDYDLTASAAGQSNVQVRWGYHAGQLAYSGWNIDDVRFLVPMTGTINSWGLYCEPMRYVKTPSLDFSTDTSVKLDFKRWLNTGADSIATIDCYDPTAGAWVNVFNNGGAAITDDVWKAPADTEINLTPYAASRDGVFVRWGYHAGQTEYTGWNVDDVEFMVPESGVLGTVNSWKLQVEPMYYLTSDAMSFSGVSNGESVQLRFYRWLNTGADSRATIEYSADNGSTWATVWQNTDEAASGLITDAEWTLQTVDLSAYAPGKNAFKVRWGYHAGQMAYSGWNIDDVTLVTGTVGGGGLVAEPTAVTLGSYNDSFGHSPYDRVNFTDVAGLTADVDPELDTAVNWGKLSSTSPLINAGDSAATLVPYTNLDFEGDPRVILAGGPNPAPDIGADEVVAVGTINWTDCVVTAPRAAAEGLIGALAAGELRVLITLTAGQVPTQVFIAPQGVDHLFYLDTPEWFIDLVPDVSGVFWTNADPITTVLWSATGTSGGEPAEGDLIADGNGTVWVLVQGQWADPSGDAITGREVLIDTVAPVLDLESYASGSSIMSALANGAPASVFFSAPSDPAVGNPPLPGYPSAVGTLQGDNAAPWDEGRVAWVGAVAGPGGRIFFNTGSVTNGLAPAPLNVVVSAPFVDPPVMDADGNELLSADLLSRPVSGFDVYSQDAPLPAQDVLFAASGPPARWVSDMGGLSDVEVMGLYTVTDGGTRLSAQWSFVDASDVSVPGIPWLFGDTGEMYRLSAQFMAMDRAGNTTTRVADPATLCWIVRTAVDVTPKNPGEVTAREAGFSWQLARTANPQALNSPRPLFSYRIWARNVGDATAPYEPVTNWTSWSTEAATPWDFFPNHLNAILGKEVLFVVIGMDEAGNVTPWPSGELGYASDNVNKLTPATSGMNWVAFSIKAYQKPTEAIATSLTPVFWYENMSQPDAAYTAGFDGASFGPATKLLLPKGDSGKMLVAKMVIRSTVPESMVPQEEGDRVQIDWELDAPGWRWSYTFDWWFESGSGVVAGYAEDRGDPEIPDSLPFYVQPGRVYCNFPNGWDSSYGAYEPDYNLNDNQYVCTVYIAFPNTLTKMLPCTFRARTRVLPNGLAPVDDPTSPRFVFTVTPSYSQTVYPRDTQDKQPVISTETQEE